MSNKRLIIYLAITLFCGLFSFVYGLFSHGIYSMFMTYLFTIPLALGVIPELICKYVPKFRAGSAWARLMQNFAIATLATGSTLQGVVEIYGTTNSAIVYYEVAGAAFLVTAIVLWLVKLIRKPNKYPI